MTHGLPAGCYLAAHYVDRQGAVENCHYYYDDGRLELVDDEGTFLVCTFTIEQVEQARQAIRASGLSSADSLGADGIYDSAALTYIWNVEGEQGSVTNAATPVRSHAALAAFEARLHAIEDAAGCIQMAEDE